MEDIYNIDFPQQQQNSTVKQNLDSTSSPSQITPKKTLFKQPLLSLQKTRSYNSGSTYYSSSLQKEHQGYFPTTDPFQTINFSNYSMQCEHSNSLNHSPLKRNRQQFFYSSPKSEKGNQDSTDSLFFSQQKSKEFKTSFKPLDDISSFSLKRGGRKSFENPHKSQNTSLFKNNYEISGKKGKKKTWPPKEEQAKKKESEDISFEETCLYNSQQSQSSSQQLYDKQFCIKKLTINKKIKSNREICLPEDCQPYQQNLFQQNINQISNQQQNKILFNNNNSPGTGFSNNLFQSQSDSQKCLAFERSNSNNFLQSPFNQQFLDLKIQDDNINNQRNSITSISFPSKDSFDEQKKPLQNDTQDQNQTQNYKFLQDENPKLQMDYFKLNGRQTITHEQVNELIKKGEKKFLLVDCRYDYEYKGGHIKNSINCNCPEQINEKLFYDQMTQNSVIKEEDLDSQNQKSETNENSLQNYQSYIIIFYCEFSSKRGPRMYEYVRNQDRKRNTYPELTYKDIYLLQDGFKNFYHNNQELCEGEYISMFNQKYQKEMETQDEIHKQLWFQESKSNKKYQHQFGSSIL